MFSGIRITSAELDAVLFLQHDIARKNKTGKMVRETAIADARKRK